MFVQQREESVLFITLDSCRYDTFLAANASNLKSVGELHKAMAPGNFTYSSHAAMFMGFTPGIAQKADSFVNPKYGKIFKMVGGGFPGKGTEHFALEGRNIIDGFKHKSYITIGSGAVGWFDPNTKTGNNLTRDFDKFYFPGDTYSLAKQLQWIQSCLKDINDQPAFVFLNIGETHVPYYHEGASWSLESPCIPFNHKNDASECQRRQKACLEYVDTSLAPLLKAFQTSTTVICGDHGDCWGENGLWEHGFHHEKVLEVPLIFRLK